MDEGGSSKNRYSPPVGWSLEDGSSSSGAHMDQLQNYLPRFREKGPHYTSFGRITWLRTRSMGFVDG